MWKFDYSKLREIRLSKGLTLREAETLIGTNFQLISLWEKGIRTPSTRYLLKLCDSYEVIPAYFFVRDVHSSNEQHKTSEKVKNQPPDLTAGEFNRREC